MKEIKIELLSPESATIVSKTGSSIELLQIKPMAFILGNPKTNKPMFAFESSALADFLEKNDHEIEDVMMVEQRVTIGQAPRSHLELHLKLSENSYAIITEFDQVYLAKELEQKNTNRYGLLSPYHMWGIKPEAPYAYMLLTGRLVDYIDSICDEGQQKHLVYILWRDYQIERDSDFLSGGKMTITGEYMIFTAKEISNHLVVFDIAF